MIRRCSTCRALPAAASTSAASLASRRVQSVRSFSSFEEGSVTLDGQVITAIFYDSSGAISYLYVQDPGGLSGIRVVPTATESVDVGDMVTVSGTVCSGTTNGECYISGYTRKTDANLLPSPMGMCNASTAGGTYGAQPALWRTSTSEGSGLNTVGTRVRVWGKVLSMTNDAYNQVVYITDGSGLSRSSQNGLKVVYSRAADHGTIAVGSVLIVTGILGAELDGTHPVPVIRVPNKRVIHVKTNGNNGNDGCTWATAKATVQAAITAAAAATPKCDVWVAAGTYTETITLADGVAVYGGFAGTETDLRQRNWVAHPTILDGNQSGSVVTAPTGVTRTARIDGFTIQNGSADYGGGIYCADGSSVNRSSPVIANNIIKQNEAGLGGGIYCGAYSGARIVGNAIVGNTTGTYASGVYCGENTDRIEIENDTIASNGGSTVQSSKAVYFYAPNSPVQLLFLIDATGSTEDGGIISAGVNDAIDHLVQQLNAVGRGLRVAAIKFSDNYWPDHSLVSGNPYLAGVMHAFVSSTVPADITDLKNWISAPGPDGGQEYQLDILEYSKNLAPGAIPGLYIALATDEVSNSTLNISTVAADLTTAGSIVFIDPRYRDLVEYYEPLAVNGGAIEEESGNIGTFRFDHLRQAILGQ